MWYEKSNPRTSPISRALIGFAGLEGAIFRSRSHTGHVSCLANSITEDGALASVKICTKSLFEGVQGCDELS